MERVVVMVILTICFLTFCVQFNFNFETFILFSIFISLFFIFLMFCENRSFGLFKSGVIGFCDEIVFTRIHIFYIFYSFFFGSHYILFPRSKFNYIFFLYLVAVRTVVWDDG